jgi:hypothetical protein
MMVHATAVSCLQQEADPESVDVKMQTKPDGKGLEKPRVKETRGALL